MAAKLRNSKFRHVMAREWKRENWYPDIRPNTGATEATGIACSGSHIAVNWASTAGAVVALLDRTHTGKRRAEPALIHAHSGPLSDMAFSPFDDAVLATASDDATVKLWRVEGDAAPSSPFATLAGHKRRVEAVAFHPSCSALLASASGDKTVRVWDLHSAADSVCAHTLADSAWSASWNWTGSLLAVTSRDKKIRVFDPRADAGAAAEAQGHEGTKQSRATWAGRSEWLLMTTGFDRMQARQFAFWDARALQKPVRMTTLPSSSGSTTALFDGDTDLFFLAGKGEGAVRAYEAADADPWFSEVTASNSDQVCRAACLVPKTSLNLMANEIDLVLKLTANAVVPVGFYVPRQRRTFQADLYPPTPQQPSLETAEWVSGKNASPKLVAIPEPKGYYDDQDAQDATPSPQSSSPPPASSSPSVAAPRARPQAPARTSPAPQSSSRTPTPSQSPPASKKIPSIVRYTKFRHIAGQPFMQNTFFQDLRVNPNPQTLIRANPTYIAVPTQGPGGRVVVWPLQAPGGRVPSDAPWLEHGSEIVDLDTDPFDDSLIATGGEDAHVRLWRIPQGGLKAVAKSPDADLSAHSRRLCTLNFHPAARGLLVTSALDYVVKIWDVEKQATALELGGEHTDAIMNVAWDWTGARMVTACRDKRMRVFDPRSGAKPTAECVAHDGAKGFKATWAGRRQQIFSCGFSKSSERFCSLWDVRDLSKPMATKLLDSMSGLLTPYYDADADVVFMVGRGDGNVRFLEVTQEEPYLHMLTEYSSSSQFADLDVLPKTLCDVRACELVQVVRLTGSPPSAVERISFTVPRTRTEFFQDDIFPPTKSRRPSDVLGASEWLAGRNKEPVLVSLQPSDMTPLSEAPALDRGPAKYHMPTDAERQRDLTRDEVFDKFFDKMQTKKDADVSEAALKEQRKMENEQGLGAADDEWDDN
eukprot:m51a1_g12241 putative coronin 7 (931) ;mRNA; f:110441-113838